MFSCPSESEILMTVYLFARFKVFLERGTLSALLYLRASLLMCELKGEVLILCLCSILSIC